MAAKSHGKHYCKKDIDRLKSELAQLIARAKGINTKDPSALELQADVAKFSCVRLVGLVEQSLMQGARARASREARFRSLAYSLSHLMGNNFNPSNDKIASFLDRWDSTWKEAFESFLDEKMKTSLNAAVGARNSIAHGGSQGTSIRVVDEYRSAIIPIVDWIVDLFDNDGI